MIKVVLIGSGKFNANTMINYQDYKILGFRI